MKKILLWSIAALSVLSSCKEEYDLNNINTDVTINTSVVGPIGGSTIKVGDLIKKMNIDGLTSDDSTGLLVFRYDTATTIDLKPLKIELPETEKIFKASELLSDKIETQLPFFDQLSSLNYEIELKKGDEISFDCSYKINFSEGSEVGRIDSILLKECYASFFINSDMEELLQNSDLIIEFLDKKIIFNDIKEEIKVNLDGEMMRTANTEDIPIIGKFVLKRNTKVQFRTTSYVRFAVAQDGEINYKKIWGVFKMLEPQREVAEIDLDLYNDPEREFKFSLVNPKVSLDLSTNITVPMQFQISSLTAKKTSEEKEMQAVFNNNEHFYDIEIETENSSETATASCEFGSKNGSVDKIMDICPDKIVIDYAITVGDENPKFGNYCITDENFINIGLGVEVPAWIKSGSYISMTDTIKKVGIKDFLNDYDTELDRIVLSLDLFNKLPFDADIELVFFSETKSDIDTSISYITVIDNPELTQHFRIEAAEIDPVTKFATSETRKKIDAILTNNVMNDLKRIDHIGVKYKINVEESTESVKVSVNDLLGVKANFFIKAAIDIKD